MARLTLYKLSKKPQIARLRAFHLMVNDQIIRVGQTNVMGMDFEHVMDTIKKQKTTETNSPLELVFISARQSSPKKSVSRALATPATGDSKSKPSPSITSASSSKAVKAGGKKEYYSR